MQHTSQEEDQVGPATAEYCTQVFRNRYQYSEPTHGGDEQGGSAKDEGGRVSIVIGYGPNTRINQKLHKSFGGKESSHLSILFNDVFRYVFIREVLLGNWKHNALFTFIFKTKVSPSPNKLWLRCLKI